MGNVAVTQDIGKAVLGSSLSAINSKLRGPSID